MESHRIGMSTVDIVIPCYNYGRFLRQSVESALRQEGVEVRVLIIDDCSSDDSESVGLHLAENDSRVEFRRHAVNRGHIDTYNEGLLEWAASDYSMLLSADDAIAPGALARAARVMDVHPEVGMTCGMGRVVWGDDNYANNVEVPTSEFQIVAGSVFLRRCFLMGNPVCTPTAVVRTALQQRLGGYRAELPYSGDMEMWMRFAAQASVAVHRDVQAYYRRHSTNMSIRYESQVQGDILEVLKACEQFCAQWGAAFPESAEWRESMLTRISIGCCWQASTAFDRGDVKGCKVCMKLAEQVFPEIRASRVWKKIRAKMLLGQPVWQIFRPGWERFREARKSLALQSAQLPARTDSVTGWWPDTAGVDSDANPGVL